MTGDDGDDRDDLTPERVAWLHDRADKLRALIARHHPNATVFFNQTPHVKNQPMFNERLFDQNTQQELEDLPTTWGGYDKLPLEAKYHLGQGARERRTGEAAVTADDDAADTARDLQGAG